MSLYKEIQPYLDYIHSIRKLKNFISFDLVFPSKWNLPKSLVEENQIVPFEVEDSNSKGISFVVEINENSFENTLTKISKIIKINKEREMKEMLFRQTIEQLKKTFEQNDLDKLKDLYFDFAADIEETSNLETYDTESPTDIELVGERETERQKRTRSPKKTTNSTD